MKTSREKAEEFFIACNGGIDFFEEEIDRIAKILDQHAAEQREACGKAVSKYINNTLLNGDTPRPDIAKALCINAGVEDE